MKGVSFLYYTQEQIDRANQADLVLFLQSQGEPLERAGQEYRWKRHDSLTVRGNKWYRHSQSKGGGPIDFVMEFFGKSFTEAVELLTGEKGAAPPPDRPSSAPLSDFRLPPRSPDNRTARNYLTAARRIDEDVTGFFFASGDIYEDAAHHNAVFVGRDEDGIPRYAHSKGTAGNFRLDVKGSDKAFNFCYRGEGERVFVFEAPVDLLSFLCLFKKDWQKQSYLSLGGVGEKALLRFLSDRPNIKTVYLCLDSDEAGNDACSRLVKLMPEGYTVHRLIPLFKDWNEVLQHRAEITDGKYLREAVYGLKGPPQEETVEIIRILYTQLFNLLCDKADDVYGGRLPVHVRCLLDEFANIGQIPKFEKLIATIRSREISASIILQSQSQLKAIYKDNADTIVGNCDTTLFLGGKEKTTLKEMSEILGKETIDSFNTSETRGRELSHGLNYQKLGKQLMSEDEIAVMDGGKCILQLRGVRPFFSEKYDITKHPKYKYLSDFDKKNAFDMEKHLRRRPAIVKPDEVFDYYEVDEADLQEDTE